MLVVIVVMVVVVVAVMAVNTTVDHLGDIRPSHVLHPVLHVLLVDCVAVFCISDFATPTVFLHP